MGLDLSLRATGKSVLREDGANVTVVYRNSMKGVPRLSAIHNNVVETARSTKPELVVIEGYSFGSTHRAEAIGELGGVIRLALHVRGHRMLIVPPKTLKKFATGNGNAKKSDMKSKAWSRWQFEGVDDNAVDAFCLAKLGEFCLHGWESEEVQELLGKCELIEPEE